MHSLDFAIIFGFLGLILFIGIRSGRKIKTFEEYAIGNRSFSDFALFCTVIATKVTGATTLGFAGKVYDVGLVHTLARVGKPIAYLVVAFFIVTRIRKFYGCVSLGDIFEKSYGKHGKVTAGFVTFFKLSLAVSVQLAAMGLVFNSFLSDFSYEQCVLLSSIIILIYTGRGGMKGVTYTDVLQFVMLGITIPMIIAIAFNKIGSFENFVNALPKSHVTITQTEGSYLATYIPLLLAFSLPSLGPSSVQRVLATKNTVQGFRIYNITAIIYLFIIISIIFVGLIGIVLYPSLEKPDQLIVILIKDLMPVGVKGFAIAGMLAVVMSSTDSIFNSGSVAISNDLIFPYLERKKKKAISEKLKIRITRGITYLAGIVSTIMAISYNRIFELNVFTKSIWFVTVVVPLYFCIFNRKVSLKGFFISLTVGLTTMTLWSLYLKPITKIHALFPAFFANFITFTTFYFLGGRKKVFKDPPEEGLLHTLSEHKFYEKRFDEDSFKVKTNIFIGIFLITVQILPMLFFYGPVSTTRAFLVLISGAFAMMLIFGHAFGDLYKKHYELLQQLTLIVCVPVTAVYLLFTTPDNIIHLFNLGLSLILLMILSRWQKLRLLLSCIAFFVAIISALLITKTSLYIKPGFHWHYILDAFGFIVFVLVIWFRGKEIAMSIEYERMQTRYDISRSVAHDLMSPIMSLSLSINKIKPGSLPEEDMKMCRTSLSNLMGVAESIMPGQETKYKVTSVYKLNNLVERCVRMKQFIYNNLDIEFIEQDKVEASVNQLWFARTMDNLINSCIDAISGEENKLQIVIKKEGTNACILLKGSKGCELSQENLKAVFNKNEKFGQETGLGIGLVGIRKFLAAWQGSLSIEKENNNAYVKILLPLA